MNIANMGEDRVVEIITGYFSSHAQIPLGIGDDCAVVDPLPRNYVQLLKTDAMVEGIHFTPETPGTAVGRKALARVLSDFAAMGADPSYALVSLGLPGNLDIRKLRGIAKGIGDLARKYSTTVVGGETVRTTGPLFISIAATGRCLKNRYISRKGARPGDLIFVTGELGNSIGGHHLSFTPRLSEGKWIAEEIQPTAMMDLSDGLGTDLPRLAKASKVGYEIEETNLPLRRGANAQSGWTDGEDYELLFTLPVSKAAALKKQWQKAFPKTRLSQIGVITPTNTKTHGRGFDHFTQV